MSKRRISHVIGVDDAPFTREHRGDVPIVATVFSNTRLEGVLTGKVRRDGVNATRALCELIQKSRFRLHLQAVLLQGIALAGFNVVDIHQLNQKLGIPVLVVARKAPGMEGVKQALLTRVRGGKKKWRLIEKAGPMELLGKVYVQRAGLTPSEAQSLLTRLSVHSHIPEPLRVAHLIAGAITTGQSTASRV